MVCVSSSSSSSSSRCHGGRQQTCGVTRPLDVIPAHHSMSSAWCISKGTASHTQPMHVCSCWTAECACIWSLLLPCSTVSSENPKLVVEHLLPQHMCCGSSGGRTCTRSASTGRAGCREHHVAGCTMHPVASWTLAVHCIAQCANAHCTVTVQQQRLMCKLHFHLLHDCGVRVSYAAHVGTLRLIFGYWITRSHLLVLACALSEVMTSSHSFTGPATGLAVHCTPCSLTVHCIPCSLTVQCAPCSLTVHCTPCSLTVQCAPCSLTVHCTPCSLDLQCAPCSLTVHCTPCSSSCCSPQGGSCY
jgi:hypothetical protein